MMEMLPPAGWGDVARDRDMTLGFGAVDRRFESVDRRFDAIDHRFASIDRRFDAIDHRFASIDHRFDSIEKQIAQTNRFIGWMMATNATNAALVGAVTLVVTLVR